MCPRFQKIHFPGPLPDPTPFCYLHSDDFGSYWLNGKMAEDLSFSQKVTSPPPALPSGKYFQEASVLVSRSNMLM